MAAHKTAAGDKGNDFMGPMVKPVRTKKPSSGVVEHNVRHPNGPDLGAKPHFRPWHSLC